MRSKIVIISLIFILAIVGISCVSAEDIDDVSNISAVDDADISIDDSIDDDCLRANIGNQDPGVNSYITVNSWTALDGALNGTSGYDTVGIGSSMAPEKQIVINHDVTIVGSANTYIGGSDSNHMASYNYIPFMVSQDGLSITLKNIRFQNCGNNIFIQFSGNGNYLIENCTFTNMYASGDHQSVVYLNNGHGNITSCTFENCTTSFGTVTNHRAGSVNVHMIVRDSTFKNNYATTEPGAINNCAHLIVYDTTFENNEATWWAGAIHTHINANTTIVRSTFRNNLAGWNGGALYTYSYLRVINSTFIGNNATTNTGGGAIGASSYGSRPTVIVENSKFENNTALTGNGGAIVISSGTLSVSDSEFINNAAPKASGGAISTSTSTATIYNCEFKYNSANETSGKGGAVYGAGKGSLTVDRCLFVNNSANDNYGHALAYYYTGNSNTAAYLTYINNRFYGPNNGTGSVYIYNNKVNVTHYNNTIEDYSNYTEPENNTNGTTGNVIPIPPEASLGEVDWYENFTGSITGTPVISGNYILIPVDNTLYCYYLDGTYVWNVTSQWGHFHELLIENNIVYAPCSWDRLFILNLSNGNSLNTTNIYQGSSIYAPVIYNDTIYICSEYGYGENNNTWITMVKQINGNYTYYDSILELDNVSYGTQAMLSKPVIKGNYLYVNTIYGLIRYNLLDNTMINITDTVGNFVMNDNGNICILRNINGSTHLCLLDSNLNTLSSASLNSNCHMLTSDGEGNIYTVDDNGYIHYASYSSSAITGCHVTAFNINPVLSAMACDDEYLYIGDDAGILWVFDINLLNRPTIYQSLEWAFNTTGPIIGGISVDYEDEYPVVYIGNSNGEFYKIE